MKKIKILMLHLGYGGVEKQTITMANNLADYYNIEIVSFYKLNEKPAYDINKKINIKYLYDGSPNKENLKESLKKLNIINFFKECLKAIKILYLKKHLIKKEILIDDADILFSTRTEYGILLSKFGKSNKIKLTQEHNFFDDKKYKDKILKGYKNLNYIIVISKHHEKMYKNWFSNSKVKIVRIENCLEELPKKSSKLNNNNIIAVGRLNYIKGFLNLIEVMKYVVQDNPNINLYLLGDGEEKEKIENKIKEYNLKNNIKMLGFVSSQKIKEYMLKSDIYIMTSIRECFPMVLLEANSCGLPVISYNILTGPNEMIINGENGYLINDRDCKIMAKKILDLLNDKQKLKIMSKKSREISEKYLIENISEKWRRLFK